MMMILKNNMIGIYAFIIKNLIIDGTNDNFGIPIYIGQSINIEKRKYQHLHCIPKTKADKFLQENSNNIEFIILEECLKEELDEKEEEWVYKYYSNKKYALLNNLEYVGTAKRCQILRLTKENAIKIRKSFFEDYRKTWNTEKDFFKLFQQYTRRQICNCIYYKTFKNILPEYNTEKYYKYENYEEIIGNRIYCHSKLVYSLGQPCLHFQDFEE